MVKFPNLSWLTFPHQCMHSQGHWPWLCNRSPHVAQFTPLHNIGSQLWTDIVRWWHKMHYLELSAGGICSCIHHLPGPAKHKSLCKSYPYFFEARQPFTKGLPRSLTLGPCQVPHHSIFNKCVWVILLVAPLYTGMSSSVPFLLKYIQVHRIAYVCINIRSTGSKGLSLPVNPTRSASIARSRYTCIKIIVIVFVY